MHIKMNLIFLYIVYHWYGHSFLEMEGAHLYFNARVWTWNHITFGGIDTGSYSSIANASSIVVYMGSYVQDIGIQGWHESIRTP